MANTIQDPRQARRLDGIPAFFDAIAEARAASALACGYALLVSWRGLSDGFGVRAEQTLRFRRCGGGARLGGGDPVGDARVDAKRVAHCGRGSDPSTTPGSSSSKTDGWGTVLTDSRGEGHHLAAQVTGEGERVADRRPHLIARQILRDALRTLEESGFLEHDGLESVAAHVPVDANIIEVVVIHRELSNDEHQFCDTRTLSHAGGGPDVHLAYRWLPLTETCPDCTRW